MDLKFTVKKDENKLLGLVGGLLGAKLAIIIYVIISMTNEYYPVVTPILFTVLPMTGFMYLPKWINEKREKPEEEEMGVSKFGEKRSKFFYEYPEMTLFSTFFTVIFAVGGAYIGEVINLAVLAKGINPEFSFFYCLSYSFSEVFVEPTVSGYLYANWIQIIIIVIVMGVISVVAPMAVKKKNGKWENRTGF
jgi:hypothetical protein